MRGRKAQPAEIKEARGNPGRRRIARTPDALPGMSIKPPTDLDAAAKRIWAKLAPDLERVRFLRATDANAFSRYCHHMARWWQLTKDLKEEGDTYVSTSAHGDLKRINPKFQVRDRIEAALERLEDRFGLTPATRQQLLQKLMHVPTDGVPQRADLFGSPAIPAEAAPGDDATVSPLGLLNTGAQVH